MSQLLSKESSYFNKQKWEGSRERKAFWIIGNNGLWEEWLFHRMNAFSATGKKSHLEITFMDPFSFSSIYFFIIWNLTDRSYLIIACVVTRTFQGSFRGIKLLHFIHIYYILYHIHKYRYMTKKYEMIGKKLVTVIASKNVHEKRGAFIVYFKNFCTVCFYRESVFLLSFFKINK